jgi:hypothetical protein
MSKKTTTNIRYVNLNNGTTLAAYIAETCVRANKLKDRIQVAAVGIMAHTGTHRNIPQGVKYLNDLTKGLGQGIQVQALVDWFCEFGGVFSSETNEFVSIDLTVLSAKHVESKQVHWVSFAPAPIYKGYDDNAKLDAYIKAANEAAETKRTDSEKAGQITVDLNRLSVITAINGMSAEQLADFMQRANMNNATSVETETITTDFSLGLEEQEVGAA